MKKINFNPLAFLASLGAGGIAVMPFAFLQYVYQDHSAGLIARSQISGGDEYSFWFLFLEAVMIVFTLLHFVLTIIFSQKFFSWLKTENFKKILYSPLQNSILATPFISIAMTMNVFIGPIRFFIPAMAENLQSLMLPALVFWIVVWFFLMWTEIKLLKISFEKGFDVNKINFGWLLHPFALGMVTVVGTGIGAMAMNHKIADTAVFLSLISGSMGFFLLIVKMIMIFKSHFSAEQLPDRKFLPSFLIIIPNITLYSISAFRFGHYLEHSKGFDMEAFNLAVILISFTFEVWYMAFGLSLLQNYFKNNFWGKEFYFAQWGLICPVVAMGVLGSFVYSIFINSKILYGFIFFTIILSVILFLIILRRHFQCCFVKENLNERKISCEE